MARKNWTDDEKRAACADLAARLDQLPQIGPDENGSYMAAHQAYRAASNQIVIRAIASYGARISDGAVTCRVNMMGLTVTCTAGPAAALKRWVQRMIDILAEPTPEEDR
ncbi:MAG: hypothetical protein Q4G25_16745 [Paracoccus sp. (in: a-proteobacteria)]|nr:hypothetical protein [Paracoccus sp. (in: a-proteobacteria)]